ncbi:MAG: hypothetical protein IJ704_05530 [Bacilli bacterium]|nr:hypothetical protein [Bacilli bacterium]
MDEPQTKQNRKKDTLSNTTSFKVLEVQESKKKKRTIKQSMDLEKPSFVLPIEEEEQEKKKTLGDKSFWVFAGITTLLSFLASYSIAYLILHSIWK